MVEARRARPGQAHGARSLRSAPPPPARSLTAPRLAARGAGWLPMGQARHRGCSGLSPRLLRPRPRPALPCPPGSAGLARFPRAPPRPAGLAARPGAGSLKGRRARAAPLASALAVKGPAPRAGRELLKRHTRLPAPRAERASRGVSPPQGAGWTGRQPGWRRASPAAARCPGCTEAWS